MIEHRKYAVRDSFLAKFAQPPLARERKESNGGKDGEKGKDYEKYPVCKWMPEWKTGRDWLMFDADLLVLQRAKRFVQ